MCVVEGGWGLQTSVPDSLSTPSSVTRLIPGSKPTPTGREPAAVPHTAAVLTSILNFAHNIEPVQFTATILILFVARIFLSGFFEILAKTVILYTIHFPTPTATGKGAGAGDNSLQ